MGAPRVVKFVEPREEALERLLLLMCEELIPEDLEELGTPEKVRLAERLTSEAAFWLDFAPRGATPVPTAQAERLGAARVRERREEFDLVEGDLIPREGPQAKRVIDARRFVQRRGDV